MQMQSWDLPQWFFRWSVLLLWYVIYLVQFVEACMYYTCTICFNTKILIWNSWKSDILMCVVRGPPENCWGSGAPVQRTGGTGGSYGPGHRWPTRIDLWIDPSLPCHWCFLAVLHATDTLWHACIDFLTYSDDHPSGLCPSREQSQRASEDISGLYRSFPAVFERLSAKKGSSAL